MGVMPCGPLVRLIGLSRLSASTRITSPKPKGNDGEIIATQTQDWEAK